jgi:hypothetical protein
MSLFFKPRGEERSMAWWATGVDSLQHRMSPENAPKLAPLFAAFRHIVDYGSTLPVDAYRKDGATRTEIALPQLFAQLDAPGGPGLVSWLGQAFYGLALGNAVGWINGFDGFGFPTDVTWLHWSQWSYDERTKQWLMFGQPVPSSQIVHIPWIVPPGRKLGSVAAGMPRRDHLRRLVVAGIRRHPPRRRAAAVGHQEHGAGT